MRPPPPAWVHDAAFAAKVKADREAAAADKFMRWACRKAGGFRGLTAAEVDGALDANGGGPGAVLAQLVPEIPWSSAVFVARPAKGADRLDLGVFARKLPNGLPEVTATPLWAAFDAEPDAFAFFKAAGIKGADKRLFCMFKLADVMFGIGRVRYVVPQRKDHLACMSVEDYMASAM